MALISSSGKDPLENTSSRTTRVNAQAKPKRPRPQQERVVKAEEQDEDTSEQGLRPDTFETYIGQKALKESLNIAIQAARQRHESVDHILLYGPPGLGKTTLSMIIAKQMEVNIKITSAPALERPRDIAGILTSLQNHDLLFIDEIHRLNRITEEILYPAMEDFSLDITIGKGQTARIKRLPLKKFTLVGATTKAGSLTSPLRDRFGLIHRLNFYEVEELSQILLRSAEVLKVNLTQEGSLIIAQRARGTPRIANRLLKRVRDFAQVKGKKIIDNNVAKEALSLLDIDEKGLDPTDRMIINTIIDNYNGGPVGLDTIAAATNEDSTTIEDVYEPYLIQIGFLNRTPRGRVVTHLAYQHVNKW